MSFDFTTPISAYEFLAIILAILALVIPFFKWLYNEKVKRVKVDFLPSGMITLYYNRSGSYISLGGVFEARNKAAIVKEITAKVIRGSDSAALALLWSSFSSPIVKKIAGTMERSFETAHPFRIDKDSLYPVFVEFQHANVNADEVFIKLAMPALNVANSFASQVNADYSSAVYQTKSTKEYHDACLALNDYFFWKCDSYRLIMTTKYEDSTIEKEYVFSISDEESRKLRTNLDALLIEPISKRFMFFPPINTIRKDYKETVS